MRTVKASEVRKGMRVRVSKESHGVTTTVEGEVTQGWTQTNPCVIFADGSHKFLGSDHPVTVLAEPEPEWVEGAWYWCSCAGEEARPLRRVEGGWTYKSGADIARILLDEENITVLWRVLIVDWPGDDVARELDAINDGNRSTSLSNYGRTTTHDTILRNVADAIRTQGGAR